MKEKSLGRELIGEIFGTFILILLGDGVVANVGLAPRLAAGAYNWNTITLGWAFAVIVAVYVTGGVSGAHINPAVTIGLAVKRGFPWKKVFPYIIAQVVGAFLGALAVYLCYRDGLVAAGLPNVWCTGPGSVFGQAFWGGGGATAVGHYSLITACLTEISAQWFLCGASLRAETPRIWVSCTTWGHSSLASPFSLLVSPCGGPSGYAINPARDFGPRLFGLVVGDHRPVRRNLIGWPLQSFR